jgi:hypothetical protein
VGAAANVAAKAPRLAKLAKLLEKLTGILKSAGPLHHLPTREVPGSAASNARSGSSKPPSRNALQGGGMPEVQTPQNKPASGASRDPIDKSKGKDYEESYKIEITKKTSRTGVGTTGEGIPIERVKPEVLQEMHPDRNAAYGYSPRKGTAYYNFDFTDVDAAKKNRKIRSEYLDGSMRLENKINMMRAEGVLSDEIGRFVVNERNLQKIEARKYMSSEEIIVLEERNFVRYKNPVGPTPEQAFKDQKKKLIRSGEYSCDNQVWDRVIEKSMEKDDVVNTLLGIEHH